MDRTCDNPVVLRVSRNPSRVGVPRCRSGREVTSNLFAGNPLPPARLPPQSITTLRMLRLGSRPMGGSRECAVERILLFSIHGKRGGGGRSSILLFPTHGTKGWGKRGGGSHPRRAPRYIYWRPTNRNVLDVRKHRSMCPPGQEEPAGKGEPCPHLSREIKCVGNIYVRDNFEIATRCTPDNVVAISCFSDTTGNGLAQPPRAPQAVPAGKSAAEHHHHTDHASDSGVAAAAAAVSPRRAHRVPLLRGMPGVPSDPDPASVCAPAAALKKCAVLCTGGRNRLRCLLVVELRHRLQDGGGHFCAPRPCGECTQEDMTKFRAMYWGLPKTFNPTKFEPEPASWAASAKAARMKTS